MIDTSKFTPESFPPYGHMVQEWEQLTIQPRTPPSAWRGDIPYEDWRTGIVELLSLILWPRFDAVERVWLGRSRSSMLALTLKDFELLATLREIIRENSNVQNESITNYALFQIEDEHDAVDEQGVVRLKRNVDTTLRKYLSGIIPPDQVEDIVGGYLTGLGSKAGNVDLDTKIDMQRPRPYQMSYILGIDGFSAQHAKSSLSPSMISGHCEELMMGGVSAFIRARELGVSGGGMAALAQHTVDVGDRRVFAGVHYPSDNLSSWITGLLLYPHVSSVDAGAEWLWRTISTRSAVFKAISTALANDGDKSPYAPPMQLLNRIGRGEVTSVDRAIAVATELVGGC